jgi:hypothetical protein
MDSSFSNWLKPYADVLNAGYLEFIRREVDAQKIYYYCPATICGLLQTEEFARHLTDANGTGIFAADSIEKVVAVRLARQWHVLGRPNPPALHVVLDEANILRRIGGSAVMQGQLKHLLDMSQLPFVTLQVLPLEARNYVGYIFEVSCIQGPKSTTVDFVGVETLADMLTMVDDVNCLYHKSVVDRMAKSALNPEQSRDRIRTALRRMSNGG